MGDMSGDLCRKRGNRGAGPIHNKGPLASSSSGGRPNPIKRATDNDVDKQRCRCQCQSPPGPGRMEGHLPRKKRSCGVGGYNSDQLSDGSSVEHDSGMTVKAK